jgi:PST family polysaccharide transporter
MLEKITILTMPGTAFLIATSDWLVRLVLGPQWTEASRLFAILGVAALVQPVANTAGWLFVSQGRTRQLLQWGLVGSTLLVAAIVAGLPWGAAGVATSYSAVSLIVVTPLLAWFVGRQGPVRAADLYRTAAPAACAAMSVLVALGALRLWWLRTGAVPGLLVCFGCTLFVTYGVLYSSARGRRALGDIWATGRGLLGSR